MNSTKPIFKDKSTVCIDIKEFEYLIQCEKELHDIKAIIGEMRGGK